MKAITLTTDFGYNDAYVGVMKGVILSSAPSVNIIDLSHQIPAQDIVQASYHIQANYRFFPQGTIHVIVVDPGVGSERDIILFLHDNHLFLAPDNGVLSKLFRKTIHQEAYLVERPDLYLQPVSQTFHGRDIFAPVAAYLARGNDPSGIGSAVDIDQLQTVTLPEVTIDIENKQISGAIISIDQFGNIITNITADNISELHTCQDNLQLILGSHRIQSIYNDYLSINSGQIAMIINSSNHLEITVNLGRAADKIKPSLYDKVTLSVC